LKIGENNKNKYATQQHGRGEKKKWVKQKIYADSQDSTKWVRKKKKKKKGKKREKKKKTKKKKK